MISLLTAPQSERWYLWYAALWQSYMFPLMLECFPASKAISWAWQTFSYTEWVTFTDRWVTFCGFATQMDNMKQLNPTTFGNGFWRYVSATSAYTSTTLQWNFLIDKKLYAWSSILKNIIIWLTLWESSNTNGANNFNGTATIVLKKVTSWWAISTLGTFPSIAVSLSNSTAFSWWDYWAALTWAWYTIADDDMVYFDISITWTLWIAWTTSNFWFTRQSNTESFISVS